MAYKSKNLSSSKRKAFSAKSDTQSELHKALSNINSASREKLVLDKMIKDNDKLRSTTRTMAVYGKRSQDDMEFAKTDYDSFKSNYDNLIKTDKYKDSTDNFFPEFDDFYKKRAKARVGGTEMSQSDMSMGNFDIDKLNLTMQLMQMNQGK